MVNHRLHMEFVEVVRQTAQLRLAAYQLRTARYFNGMMKFKTLQVGDQVLKKVMAHTKTVGHGVFGAN